MKLRHQSGVIMIEVLVSIAVLAFGILGLAALQTYSLQAAKEAYTRSIASDLANDMIERIRALRSPTLCMTEDLATCGKDAAGLPAPLPVAPDFATISTKTSLTDCGATSLACQEFFSWKALATNSLPDSSVIICRDNSPSDGSPTNGACSSNATDPLVIKIWWTERASKKGGSNATRLFYTSFL